MSAAQPVPVPDALTEPFWAGCREGRLLVQGCRDCGRSRFPPAPICPHCGSPRSGWIEASGRARIYSWIVVRHPVPAEVYAEEVPYVVALVELDEGVRMPTRIVDCEPEAVSAGMAVEVVFRPHGENFRLPLFRPDNRSQGSRPTAEETIR